MPGRIRAGGKGHTYANPLPLAYKPGAEATYTRRWALEMAEWADGRHGVREWGPGHLGPHRAEDLKQAAAVMASFAYHAAMRDAKMPRKPEPKPAP